MHVSLKTLAWHELLARHFPQWFEKARHHLCADNPNDPYFLQVVDWMRRHYPDFTWDPHGPPPAKFTPNKRPAKPPTPAAAQQQQEEGEPQRKKVRGDVPPPPAAAQQEGPEAPRAVPMEGEAEAGGGGVTAGEAEEGSPVQAAGGDAESSTQASNSRAESGEGCLEKAASGALEGADTASQKDPQADAQEGSAMTCREETTGRAQE